MEAVGRARQPLERERGRHQHLFRQGRREVARHDRDADPHAPRVALPASGRRHRLPGVSRRLAAPDVVVIDHVVVQERHRVQQLERRRRVPDLLAVAAGGAVPPKAKGRPEPLAARFHEPDDLVDRLGRARGECLRRRALVVEERPEHGVDVFGHPGEGGDGGGPTSATWPPVWQAVEARAAPPMPMMRAIP